MVGIDDFVIGFAASLIAGNIPTIQSVMKGDSSLSQKIENCYQKAITRWCPNAEIRKKEYENLKSIEALRKYLSSTDKIIDEKTANFFQYWADEMRNDQHCYNVILELKDDILNAKMDAFTQKLYEVICKLQNTYKSFYDASLCLKNIRSTVGNDFHIDRKETELLYAWLKHPVDVAKKENVLLLLGGAGEGKSVILHDLMEKLQAEGTKVLGIKSDLLFDSSETDIDKKLNIGISVRSAFQEESEKVQIVLLVDQIDALSATLSSDRRPLMVLNSLINEVSTLPNVRIIVSCRPYDLEYDSSLEQYRHLQNIQVGSLDKEQLINALCHNEVDISTLSLTLQSLIAIPQNLFLYLRLKNKAVDITSQNSLYNALWNEVVMKIPEKVGTIEKVVEYLSLLSDRLYEKQTLAINETLLGTEWSKIQTYLITQGFLYKDDTSKNIQFVHQTLYDYVFARLFTESCKTIEDVFENEHQGLFVRPRIRQVIEYQRDVDVELYVKNLKRILFQKSINGNYLYRYQLRHLSLTLLAYNSTLYNEEKYFILRSIFTSETYIHLFVSSAKSKDAYELITGYIKSKGGFTHISAELKEDSIRMISRICVKYPETLVYLCSICTPELDEISKQQIARVVDYAGANIPTDKNLEILSDYIEEGANDIVTCEYYEKLCEVNPTKVRKRLCDIVSIAIHNNSTKSAFDININYQTKYVYDCLKNKNKPQFVELCLELLKLLTTISCGIKEDIQTSKFFYIYNRNNTALYFPDMVLNDLLFELESQSLLAGDRERIVKFSYKQAIDVFHIVGMVGCMADIDSLFEEAYNYLKLNIPKVHHSSSLDYYQKTLFKRTFMKLSLEQQGMLMQVIGKLNPEWEKMPVEGSLNSTYPIFRIGYTRAQYYNLVPIEYLKKYFTEEYVFLIEMQRKYRNLENKEPNAVNFMSRWTTMEQSAYKRMRKEDILKSMEAYNTDDDWDWSVPSKTGHALVLKAEAKENPDLYFDVYSEAVNNLSIDLDYVIKGIEGLMDANYDIVKIDGLLGKLIERFDLTAINNNNRSDLIQTVRRSSYYIDNRIPIPESFFSFLCNVALNVVDETDESGTVDISTGINQVRGAACNSIVQCCYDPSKVELIFSMLDSVAETKPSLATRCAVLFQIGLLLKYDRVKVYNLVLNLTSDYNENLMRLPLHSLNPLLYLNSEEFDRFIPYFEASVGRSSTHEVITTLLLRAYLTDKKDSKRLLMSITDVSETARCTLVREIKSYYQIQYHDKCYELLGRYMKYDEPKLGQSYDAIFLLLDLWKSDVKEYIDKLIVSPVCKYCNNYIYKYLTEVSVTDPHQCLEWLTSLYHLKKDFNDNNIRIDRIITILVSAYNAISIFDKGDVILEDAMDLLDEVLVNNANYWNSIDCLNNIDPWEN